MSAWINSINGNVIGSGVVTLKEEGNILGMCPYGCPWHHRAQLLVYNAKEIITH